MRNLILTTVVLLLSVGAQAQSFKVIKIQGKKAIVEVSDPTAIQTNQTYNVGGGDTGGASASGGNASMSTGERKYGVGLGAVISSTKSDAAGAEAATVISVDGKFVWNMKSFEVGPIVGISTLKAGSALEQTGFSLGGIGYYNFQPNQIGTPSILSVVGQIEMENTSTTTTVLTTSTTSKSSNMNIALGGAYRMFLLSTDHSIEIQGLYVMNKQTPDPGTASTVSGFQVSAGISTYF